MYQLISTEAIPPEHRREYWQAAIQPLFFRRDCHVLPQNEAQGAFHASVRHASIGDLGFLKLDSCAHAVERGHHHIRDDDEPSFLMSLVSEGSGYLIQDGKESLQCAGDFVLYDSQRPFRLGHEGRVKKYVLKIPRRMLTGHLAQPEKLCGTTVGVHSAVRIMLKSLLDSVASSDMPLSDVEQHAIAKSMVELIVGGLQSLSPSLTSDPNKLKAYHLTRIKRYVQDQLADPDLSCESIARAMRMSVSSLYRVFEDEPVPVAKWIWQMRLDACAMDLKDPTLRHLSISEIAFNRGFGSCAHFSRAFKAQLSVTPTAYRQSSQGT
jgi:AraC-like DNA-binding protein